MFDCSNNDRRAAARPDGLADRARALLGQALELIDRAGMPGHIGARLQHAIDDLDAAL